MGDASEFATLTARVDALQQTCISLSEENAQLREAVAGWSVRGPATPRPPGLQRPREQVDISRRSLLRKAGAAAAVGAVASVALVDLGGRPASAATGNPVTAGAITLAEGRTSVRYDGTAGFSGVVLLGNDSTYDGSGANFPAGVGGWAGAGGTAGSGGVANGVYGFTDNGAGNGVVGYNSNFVNGSGNGVQGLAFGATATGVLGKNTLGTAVSGSSDSTAASAAAVLGVITSAAPGSFSAALRGQNNGTAGLGIGVYGSQQGSGWGVYATSVSGIGVNASGGTGTGVAASGTTGVSGSGGSIGVQGTGGTSHGVRGLVGTAGGSRAQSGVVGEAGAGLRGVLGLSASGIGVEGFSSSGPGVIGQSTSGYGVQATGGLSQLYLVPAATVGHPTTGAHKTGELFLDKSGSLFLCAASGSPGTWKTVQVA